MIDKRHTQAIRDVVAVLREAAQHRDEDETHRLAYAVVVLQDATVALTLGLQFGLTFDQLLVNMIAAEEKQP